MGDADFDYESAVFACARGDEAALRRLYEHEARWLMGVALRIVRRRELADEVVHDAFLQIWQKSNTYSAVLGSARGWIYSVVRHKALDVARNFHRESPIDAENLIIDVASEDLGPLDTLSKGSEAKALHHCMEQLDEQKRTCLLLAYMEGYSQAQISDYLACPLGTVKAWMRRGLLALKDCLS